jgi:rhamnogalacturonan endolyase
LNYIGGGHFGGGRSATTDKPKMFGPWLLYFNTASQPDALIRDALAKAREEQARWPYPWVNEPLYPTKRTKVTGQLKVADGRSAGGAWVVLARPGGGVYNQGGDYIFYTHADANGTFELPHVRPGS